MNRGRPKLEISRLKQLNIRLTKSEFDEIENLAKKLKISKSELVLRGIKNLSQIQPVYYRNRQKKIPKQSEGIIAED